MIRDKDLFRADRVLTLYFVRPLLCRSLSQDPSSLPILMYHSICDGDENGRSPYYRTNTSPSAFQEQMRSLDHDGYVGMSLEDALPILRGDEPKRKKIAVITFDDGYRNFLSDAFPVIRQYGFSATVFLATGFVGDRRNAFNGTRCLSWEEVEELHRHGIRFGSHTVNHRKLHGLEWSEVESELRASKESIEKRINEPVLSFAYPYAYPQADKHFVRKFTSLLTKSAYVCCVTTMIGCTRIEDDPFSLKRLPINTCDDLPLFRAKLQGAYNWLNFPQSLVKTCKQWIQNNRIVQRNSEVFSS
jgi:peptidoglycan/xylan/chitin deacetylase (PgdA/CDA1 family)